MKIFQTKSIIFAIATAMVVLTTLPILQSCSKDDEPQILESKQLEYLDMDVSNLQNPTKEQLLILESGKNRIDKYVALRNHKFELSVVNGKAINMSEQLFEYYKQSLFETNEMLKGESSVIDIKDSKIARCNKPNLTKNTRFKSIAEYKFLDGKWQITVDVLWYGADISFSHNAVVTIFAGGTVTGLVLLPEAIYTKAIAIVVAVGTWHYECFGHDKGVTVHLRPWGTSFDYNE